MSRRGDKDRSSGRGRGVGGSSRRRRQWRQWTQEDLDETLSDDDDYQSARIPAHVVQQPGQSGGTGPSHQSQPLPNPNDFPVPIFQTPTDDISAVRWPAVPTQVPAAIAQADADQWSDALTEQPDEWSDAEEPEPEVCSICRGEAHEPTGMAGTDEDFDSGPLLYPCDCRGKDIGRYHYQCMTSWLLNSRDQNCRYCHQPQRARQMRRYVPEVPTFWRALDPFRTGTPMAVVRIMYLTASVVLFFVFAYFWHMDEDRAVRDGLMSLLTAFVAFLLMVYEYIQYRRRMVRAIGGIVPANPQHRYMYITDFPAPGAAPFMYDVMANQRRPVAEVVARYPFLKAIEKSVKEEEEEEQWKDYPKLDFD